MLKAETERLFSQAIELGKKEADSTIVARYEKSSNPQYVYQYHGLRHSTEVAYRTKYILSLFHSELSGLVKNREISFYELIARNHDRLIEFDVKEEGTGELVKSTMKRYIGQNERDSTAEAIKVMGEINYHFKQQLFTPDDYELVVEAMEVTIPAFDVKTGTVYQPYLTKDSTPGAVVLACSDLNTGLVDPRRYLENGNELFREEQLDILNDLTFGGPISIRRQRFIADRMRQWSWGQEGFAITRNARFPEEIVGLPEEGQRIMLWLFSKGPDSAEAARLIAKRREDMEFPELLRSFGYHLDTRAQHFHPRHFKAA